MQPCPRGVEATMGVQLEHLKTSHWREKDGTCSYCGSLSPAQLFEAIELGYELGPTDKDYKVYVTRPDPNAGKARIDSVANFEKVEPGWLMVTAENLKDLPPTDGWSDLVGRWVHIGSTSAMRQDKFYFQHLSVDERKRFVELLNAKKLNIGYPGRFYVLPFFCVREKVRT